MLPVGPPGSRHVRYTQPRRKMGGRLVRAIKIALLAQQRYWPASRHENLIGGRNRVTGRRPARDDVNPARDRRCAKTVAGRRHTRMIAPAIAPAIVGLHLVEGARWRLAPEHEH